MTEAMKGQCRRPIADLLDTPLFNNSLELWNESPLTTELSLEDAVSSAFPYVVSIALPSLVMY